MPRNMLIFAKGQAANDNPTQDSNTARRHSMRPLLLGAAVMTIMASPALAADNDCGKMIKRFDRQVSPAAKAKTLVEAKKLRNAGAAALADGNKATCQKHMKQANKLISMEDAEEK